MHILPHISLSLSFCSNSFMLSWCSLLNVSNDHGTFFGSFLSTFPTHFDNTLLSVIDPMYCTVSCCTMWLSFATLPVIVWKRHRAASVFLSLSLSLCGSASACLLSVLSFSSLSSSFSSTFSSLCSSTIFLFLLSRPGMRVTYGFSLSMCLLSNTYQASSDRCNIAHNFATLLVFPHKRVEGHK